MKIVLLPIEHIPILDATPWYLHPYFRLQVLEVEPALYMKSGKAYYRLSEHPSNYALLTEGTEHLSARMRKRLNSHDLLNVHIESSFAKPYGDETNKTYSFLLKEGSDSLCETY